MKLIKNVSSITVLVVSALCSGLTFSEVVVVVNASEQIELQKPEDIADLFLSKRNDLAGLRLAPVDLPESNSARDVFYESVIGKSAAQVKAYWSRLIFTGKGVPPKQFSSDTEIAEWISENEGYIGYINSESIAEGIKVIYTLPK